MDTDTKIMAFFVFGMVTALASLVAAFIYFSNLDGKRKDRELTIRERELELKAEQYPYKNETKLEVVHD